VNGPVYPATTQQAVIGRVNDGINLECRDISADNFNHEVPRETLKCQYSVAIKQNFS
jgi:hypothetical protein